MLKSLMIAATASLALVFAVPAQAETVHYSAKLDGASEVPPTTSKGTGEAKLKYDTTTKKLEYTVEYKGLSGDPVAAHFHGPADPGANAGVELPITVGKSPIKGEATLTDAQAADLEAGKWYVNIHTAANPAGEIRGQVLPEKKKM
ncbi:MAG: domain containing protein [Rhodospirillales bacterium]|nr:domain containing protein [Rhodospirillales bacterium]